MTFPEGFRVTLFAGEPDIVQPIAFTFDDRGRLWVVECITYPKWVQPGEKGKDRVVILEDTTGDGVHDKKTVVLDDGVNLSGIELGFGGMYLCSTPNLVFVPLDGDTPAGPPELLLDGWNLKDAKHNVFNSLAWGPDGWLYGCNGIQTKSWVGKPGTPQTDRVYLDCGVWRFHPTRKVFEVVAHGTTNPWGVDWDDYGQMFITNCVIDHLWHVVPGGHYRRMYGQDPNPYTFGLMGPASDHKHWGGGHWTSARADQKTGAVQKEHDDAGGGHAHSGCMVYLGENFPAEYRNSVFMCNIHGNRVNRDTLQRIGSGYVAQHAPDFLHAHDPWFRGICVKQGPEGAVYVSDWCDTGECHNYDVADTTNGRIYRVTFGTPKPFRGDVSKLSDAELVKLHLSKNEWLVRKARRVMQERAVAGKLSGETVAQLRDIVFGHSDVTRQLRGLWTLHALGSLKPNDYTALFSNDNEYLRAGAVWLSAEKPAPNYPIQSLSALAQTEPSPFVRLYIAAAMQRLPGSISLTLAEPLMSRQDDNADPNLPTMYWYGIVATFLTNPADVADLLPKLRVHRVRENIARSVLIRPGADSANELGRIVKTLVASGDDRLRLDILRGIHEALSDRREMAPPAGWTDTYPKLVASQSAEVRDLTERLALLFGDKRALETVRGRLSDPKAPAEARRAALERLVTRKTPGLAPVLRELLADPAVRGAALRGLAAYPDDCTPAVILMHYGSFTADEKSDAVQTLASRPAFAAALLDAIEQGTIPKKDVTAFTARQIQALNDKAISDKLVTVWGTVKPASQTRAAQTAKLKSLLTADTLKAANLSNGRAIYAKSCAACHKLFDDGGDVGPELTGSQRANLDYILENVLDPNAVVPFDYRMTAFYLVDGRVVTGQIRKETPQAVTVRTANEEVLILVEDIESRKPTPNSVMPEGLLDALSDEDIRDLIAYLASPKQVPLKEDTR
jgi:putative membrane-bound dehydrogenase-like protein